MFIQKSGTWVEIRTYLKPKSEPNSNSMWVSNFRSILNNSSSNFSVGMVGPCRYGFGPTQVTPVCTCGD